MKISLFNRLRKQLHRDIASLQDEVLEIVYSVEPKAVLHGGTSIWRCFAGNRFSEDLDFYFKPKENFKSELEIALKARGLKLNKYKQTSTTIFSKISNERVEVRLEANMITTIKRPVVQAYEKLDGTYTNVFALSVEDLILEKLITYTNRKLIRDIYDVYFLSNQAQVSNETEKKIKDLLKQLPLPADEKDLKAIVYAGAVPSFEQIKQALLLKYS
ncbi:MAG: nucleotidyl transferase AbiEii/AbiGii toxin family protein [Candidatus Diapherotrites archaeon]|nr:nucleotidyl transferase AbiEii/AbiGii toxin family protein [Candidatus Diapherotrites archaeon]